MEVHHYELSTKYCDTEDGRSTSLWFEYHILMIQMMVELPNYELSTTY